MCKGDAPRNICTYHDSFNDDICKNHCSHPIMVPDTEVLERVVANYVCCSVLQCVAVCCNVLQCVAVCCSVLHCVSETRTTWRCIPSVTPKTSHITHNQKACHTYAQVMSHTHMNELCHTYERVVSRTWVMTGG